MNNMGTSGEESANPRNVVNETNSFLGNGTVGSTLLNGTGTSTLLSGTGGSTLLDQSGDDSFYQMDSQQQAIMLLQKLQDLKVWQARQESRLLQEQQEQLRNLGQLGMGEAQMGDEDDTTISSIAYDDDTSLTSQLGALAGDEEIGWADRTDVRPVTQDMRESAMRPETVTSADYDRATPTVINDRATPPTVVNESATPPNESPPNGASDTPHNGAPSLENRTSSEENSTPPYETNTPPEYESPPPNPEDQPVGVPGRTFQQLLAMQLGEDYREEPEPVMVPVEPKNTNKVITKKPFLKRGAGLARYGLTADKAEKSPPKLNRSKSQPRLGEDSKKSLEERLSLETVSFTSKKSPPKPLPKRIVSSRSLGNVSAARQPSPPTKLKLKSPTKNKNAPKSDISLSDPRQAAPRPAMMMPKPNLHDSVENSFREKLHVAEKRHTKELKELAVFEMLEDAANDSSFCSTSSKVKTLVDHSILPSPSRNLLRQTLIPKAISNGTPVIVGGNATSTPLAKGQKLLDSTNPSLGTSLMEDIKNFLEKKGAKLEEAEEEDDTLYEDESENEDDSTITDRPVTTLPAKSCIKQKQSDGEYETDEDSFEEGNDSDDNTLEETMEATMEASIGKNWRERIRAEAVAQQQNKENRANGQVMMEFEPPEKIPKNSASYLIWSIFTKEREERARRIREKKMAKSSSSSNKVLKSSSGNGQINDQGSAWLSSPATPQSDVASQNSRPQSRDVASPLSRASLQSNDDITYQSTLLHMRVVELEQEIETFKKENAKIVESKRKIQTDKQKLSKELESFEKLKEADKKKIEEEKKRLKREKLLLEKAQKEAQAQLKAAICNECEENKAKVVKMQEDLSRKENKWTAALTKLQEQLKLIEKENTNLHTENHKLKIKNVSSKVANQLPEDHKRLSEARVVSHSRKASQDTTPDSGFRTQVASAGSSSVPDSEDEFLDNELRKSISSTIYATLCEGDKRHAMQAGVMSQSGVIDTPRMTFSPAESLDSSMTLVSTTTMGAATESVQEGPKVVHNEERGTREKRFSDGRVEVWYQNGNRKEISADSDVVKVYYYNGDVKETDKSGTVKYLYSQTQTWHITYPDSREVLQFNNGQEETRHPDGSLEISFPDGSHKKISVTGSEDIVFPDGTRVQVQVNGDRILHLPSGQTEEHTKEMKKRTYPDGTVKILHNDGQQETRYSNGRVRIKDGQGNLIHDSQAG